MGKLKLKTLVLPIILAASVHGLPAQEELPIHLYITELTEGAPPALFEGSIVLSYRPSHPVRFVAAAFSHENYARLHPYSYNENGVFVLTLPMPEERETIRYRIVVDGLWMPDPNASVTVRDDSGLTLSAIAVPTRIERGETGGPEILPDGSVRFTFRGDADSRVMLAGDFNGWDPFMHRLVEYSPGRYAITLKMPPGQYRYYYFYQGVRLPDPLNGRRIAVSEGIKVSTLIVPGRS